VRWDVLAFGRSEWPELYAAAKDAGGVGDRQVVRLQEDLGVEEPRWVTIHAFREIACGEDAHGISIAAAVKYGTNGSGTRSSTPTVC
jgi:hypothetical protein